jgi:predicted metalloprotease with PDZ domain
MTLEEYLKVLDEKITNTNYYNDSLPFTVMSEGCLDKYKDQYANVYQKGALIGMCLDIKLKALSLGSYGVQELMNDLAKKYGKEKSFKDEDLFNEIVKLTYPEINEFFEKYVSGTESLPIKETLELAGITFGKVSTEKSISFGGINIGLNAENNHLLVVNTAKMDDFGKALGYQEFDELVKFNGKKININNAQDVLTDYLSNAKEGDELKITVLRRTSEKPKGKKVKLKSTVFMVAEPNKFDLSPVKNPSQKQLQVRNTWIGK